MAKLSAAAVRLVAAAGGFSGQALNEAVAMAMAGSGGDTAAQQGSRVGLFLIDPGQSGVSARELMLAPVAAATAHAIYTRDGGWSGAHWPQLSAAQSWLSSNSVGYGPGAGSPGHGPVTVGGVSGGTSTIPSWSDLATMVDGAVPNVVSDVASSAAAQVTGVDAIATDFDKAAKWITTPGSWVHILYVIGGAGLLLGGLYIVARPAVNGTANTVAKVATGNTSVGRAVKAVGGVQKRRAAAAAKQQASVAKAQAGAQRETERRATRARTQQRIEERHGMAKAREQRAAERHAERRTTKKEEDGDE